MKTKLVALGAGMTLLVAGFVPFAGGGTAFAKDGCPSESSSNGTAHANGNSAHGQAKQADRTCPGIVTDD